uniref:Uncharacterized protein n=1 Tax=viral metagenome TaxID=1070528 RepID=A0A6C0JZG4_9ZZZZ
MNIIEKLHNKTLEFVKNNDYENAVINYNKILDNIDNMKKKYLYELLNIYKTTNNHKEALVKCYLPLKLLMPNDYILINEIGICYFNLNQYDIALKYFNKIKVSTNLSDVYNNVGICYAKLKDYKNAEENFIYSNKMNNNYTSNLSLGEIYYYEKKYTKSIQYYNNIKNETTNNMNNKSYNSSFPYLANRQFLKGFELYEYRLMKNEINIQSGQKDRIEIPYLKYWNGIDKCTRLLIVYEQGIGDNIQFFRFIYELSEKYPYLKIDYFGRDVVNHLFIETENVKLIKTVMFFDNYNKMVYDHYIYIMSLPYVLKIKTISPNNLQYIKLSEDKLVEWKLKVDKLKKYKVGIVFNGLLSCFIEKNIPLTEFKQLCDLDIELICVHKKSDIDSELKNISFMDKLHLYDLDTQVPFEDTIHLLKNIDLLITVDTSIVHLAGVLGVKTWLLLGYSEWRWSNIESTTYWYDSVELIRTTKDEKELKNIMPRIKIKLQQVLDKHYNISNNIFIHC